MASLFLLPEMLSRRFRTVSWQNRPNVPNRFDYETRLDLFCQQIWDIKDNILNATHAGDATKPIPICHITYANGSEQDLYAHLVQTDDFVVFLEVSHSYIDQHFLSFQLWATDQKETPKYPTNLLFRDAAISETSVHPHKIAEVFIRPVAITIHTSHFDPAPYLPDEHTLLQLNSAISVFPWYSSWKAFEQGDYEAAATRLLAFPKLLTPADARRFLLAAFYATCKYLAGDYATAAEHFLSAGKGYLANGFHRNADVCFCFAVEAGKRITDMNVSYRLLNDIVDNLTFLGDDFRREVVNILKNYYSQVYIGAAVLCRRVIEVYLKELLAIRCRKTVQVLTKEAKASGQLAKDARRGLYTVLELAKLHGLITQEEHEIGSYIKSVGNDIHEKGGVENEIDAKYAIQSCMHILHRI